MKKNAINQFLLFVTLFFCLIFSSCINSLIDDSEDNSLPPLTFDGSDYVTISGCISPEINNGRSAFPTVPDLGSASLVYKIIVKSGEDTLITKDNNSITSWDGLTYEVNVPKGNNLQIVIEIYNTSYSISQKIFSGTSEPFNVDENTTTKNVDVTVMPLPQNEEQTGNIHLYFKNTSTKKLFVRNSLDETISFTLNVNTGTAFFNKTVSAGSYTVKFDFYENDVSGQLLFSCTQVINVYSGLTTNEWVKNGDESYIQEEGENAIVITDELIKSFQQTVFYVDSGYNGVDKNGSYFAPYNSLKTAIDHIKTLPQDSSITYKVLLKSGIAAENCLTDLNEHNIEIASFNSKCTITGSLSDSSIGQDDGGNSSITFRNLKFESTDDISIGNLKSVTFEDCVVNKQIMFENGLTEFHLKGKCSFIGGIDFTGGVVDNLRITLDSVVKPAENGFVAKVLVDIDSSFDDNLSSLFDNSETDQKLLKSLAYFCIKKEGDTENICINTGSDVVLVPLTNIKFVADGNANTNGLGVAGDDINASGSIDRPFATVEAAVNNFIDPTVTERYIFIAGNVQETNEVKFATSNTKWYLMGWNGVELDPSNPDIGKIDTITRAGSSNSSMFSINDSASSSIEVNLYNLKIDGNGVTAGTTITADSQSRKVGAGIYLAQPQSSSLYTLNLKNVWFTKCITELAGGAIYAERYNVINTDNCYFGRLKESDDSSSTCSTNNGLATFGGGAIYSKGQINLKNSKFIGCKTSNAGGAINNYCISDSYLISTIDNCTFIDNTASSGGGGIYSYVNLTINDSIFKKCSAYSGGGVYQIYRELTIKCYTKSVEFNNCSSNTMSGGAILLTDGTGSGSISCEIIGNNNFECKINNCSANTTGGGISINHNGSFSAEYLQISGCSARDQGGGIYTINYENISVALKNSAISNCKSTQSDGGGVYLANQSNLELIDSNILNCTVPDGKNGSGLYIAKIYNDVGSITMSGRTDVYTTSDTRKNDIYIDASVDVGLKPIWITEDFNPQYAKEASPMIIDIAESGTKGILWKSGSYEDEKFNNHLKLFTLDSETAKKYYFVRNKDVFTRSGMVVKIIYVSEDGNDESGDGSISKPYATTKKALSNATSSYNLIYISGTIVEDSVISADKSITISEHEVWILGIGSEHKITTTTNAENLYSIYNITGNQSVLFENIDFDQINFNYTGENANDVSSVFNVAAGSMLKLKSCNFTNIKNNTNSSKNPKSSCIYNAGEVSIINTTFGDTTASSCANGTSYSCGGSHVKGAFIYNLGSEWYGYIDIEKCIFSYGYGGDIAGAGAIYNDGGNLTFAEATNLEDKTVFQYCYGNAAGAIYNNNGTVAGANIDNCEMKECYKQQSASDSEEEIMLVRQTEG